MMGGVPSLQIALGELMTIFRRSPEASVETLYGCLPSDVLGQDSAFLMFGMVWENPATAANASNIEALK